MADCKRAFLLGMEAAACIYEARENTFVIGGGKSLRNEKANEAHKRLSKIFAELAEVAKGANNA